VFPNLLVIASFLAAILTGRLAAQPTIRRLRAQLLDAVGKLAHDPLTGLFNRAGLTAAHTALADDPQPLIVALIDLDNFKTVNDTHGHNHGDHLLVEIGQRLAELAGMCGGSAARLSGDEYALLLPLGSHRPEGIGDLAVNLLGRPVHLNADTVPTTVACTVSVGLTVVASSDPLDDIALRQADIAMYHAKHFGGNRHVAYVPGMSMAVDSRRGGPRARDLRPTPPVTRAVKP
jgi:diguanylate cyclase